MIDCPENTLLEMVQCILSIVSFSTFTALYQKGHFERFLLKPGQLFWQKLEDLDCIELAFNDNLHQMLHSHGAHRSN